MVKSNSDSSSKPVPKKIPVQPEEKSPVKKPEQSKGNLQYTKEGRIEKVKSKRPVSKITMEANKNARKAMATGELASAEIELRKQKDLRTLYIKFKDGVQQPTNEKEIRSICPSVQYVRTPRQDKKKKVLQKIQYCYLEFNSEAECDKMKEELSNSPDRFVVDYVGEKSRNLKFTSKDVSVKKLPINPMRLFVSGLPANMTVAKLKMLFPRCSEAHIKTKGSSVGFVMFKSAGEAKSAFDAAQKLSGNDAPQGIPKLTVIYARITKRQPLAKREEKKSKKKADKATVQKDGDEEKAETVEGAEVASDDDVEIKEESEDEEEVQGSGDAEEVKEESEDDNDEEVENDEDSEEEEMDDE